MAAAAAVASSAKKTLDLLTLSGSLLVVDLKGVGGVSPTEATLLTNLLVSRLAEVRGLKTIAAEDVQLMLSVERQKDLLGCDQMSCLAELGGALGTDYVLYGQFGKLGTQFSLNLTVLSSQKASVLARATWLTALDMDAMTRNISSYVRELVEKVAANGR